MGPDTPPPKKKNEPKTCTHHISQYHYIRPLPQAPSQQDTATMPLESCMILLDNSEYMRNGDYVPTRLEAQHDAANLLANHKTQSNPESTVGVVAMAGTAAGSAPGAELLVSPTDDLGKILAALHGVPPRGPGASAESGVDLPASVQVASLALKHRRNKNGAQRIVVFVGSPLGPAVEVRAMQRAGRQLKKNNVRIDVVALGELEENEPRLKELVDAANGSGGEGGERTCNLVTIPAGVLPSDVLVSSPIVGGGGAGAAAAMGSPVGGGGAGEDGGNFADYGGIDPNMDPELAMALRVSMEEERARQERVAAAAAEEAAGDGADGGGGAAGEGMEVDADGVPAAAEPAPSEAAAAAASSGGGMEDEDALLQQALAMSMAESYAAPAAADGAASAKADGSEGAAAAAKETDDDEAMQMALAMSMQVEQEEGAGGKEAEFQDPQFVNQVSGPTAATPALFVLFPASAGISCSHPFLDPPPSPSPSLPSQLLGSLPGVDPNDPAIQNALKNLKKEKDGDDKKKDGEGK